MSSINWAAPPLESQLADFTLWPGIFLLALFITIFTAIALLTKFSFFYLRTQRRTRCLATTTK